MPLDKGTRLGAYEIVSPLGAGGMGEVYRAVDTRLDREVAVKILSTEFAANVVLRKRFEREARAISSISHPNICKLFDIGELEPAEGEPFGLSYIVMELLEGRSLADRLEDGSLTLEQALRHGAEIADALDCAHQAGIVHRDLKPGNVMLTKTGARLLDFGLAKSESGGGAFGAGADHPTQPLSSEGALIGTIAYMAPEQLENRPADTRTDIFALGLVLYEMITGRRAFGGGSSPSIASAILRDEPNPMRDHVPFVPSQVERLVRRCLAKDPDDRWQSVRDVAADLRAMRDELSAGTLSSDRTPVQPTTAGLRTAVIVAAMAAVTVGAAFGWLAKSFTRAEPRGELFIASMATPEIPLGSHPLSPAIALSAGGDRIVYVGQFEESTALFLRTFDGSDDTRIEGTDGALTPFFSPDGNSVAFLRGDRLMKVDLVSTQIASVVEAPFMHGGSWCEDGTIAFSTRRKIHLVSAEGGTPQPITEPDGDEVRHYFPEFLGGCDHIMYLAVGSTAEPIRLVARDLRSDDVSTIAEKAGNARFVPPDKVIFGDDGALWMTTIDRQSLRAEEPRRILSGVAFGAPFEGGLAQFAVARNGKLAWLKGPNFLRSESEIGWGSGDGIDVILKVPGNVAGLRVSPDGLSLAFWTYEGGWDTTQFRLYRYDLDRGFVTKVSEGSGWPVWSKDGRFLYVTQFPGRHHGKIASQRSDGSEPPRTILDAGEGVLLVPVDVTDRELIYVSLEQAGPSSIRALNLASGETSILVERRDNVYVYAADLSDDERWIAYASNETGREEVFVRPYPDLDSQVQISVEGGRDPAWVSSDRAIVFLHEGRLQRVNLNLEGGEIRVGTPTSPHEGGVFLESAGPARNYDVLDGERVLVGRREYADSVSSIEIVLDWERLLVSNSSGR